MFLSEPVSLGNIVFCPITRNRQFRRQVKSNPSKLSLFFGFGKNSGLGFILDRKFLLDFLVVKNHILTMMLMGYRIIRSVIQFTVHTIWENVEGLLYLGYSKSMSPFFFRGVLPSNLASYCL